MAPTIAVVGDVRPDYVRLVVDHVAGVGLVSDGTYSPNKDPGRTAVATAVEHRAVRTGLPVRVVPLECRSRYAGAAFVGRHFITVCPITGEPMRYGSSWDELSFEPFKGQDRSLPFKMRDYRIERLADVLVVLTNDVRSGKFSRLVRLFRDADKPVVTLTPADFGPETPVRLGILIDQLVGLAPSDAQDGIAEPPAVLDTEADAEPKK